MQAVNGGNASAVGSAIANAAGAGNASAAAVAQVCTDLRFTHLHVSATLPCLSRTHVAVVWP